MLLDLRGSRDGRQRTVNRRLMNFAANQTQSFIVDPKMSNKISWLCKSSLHLAAAAAFSVRNMSWIIRLRSHVYVHEIKIFHFDSSESGSSSEISTSTSEWGARGERGCLSLINIGWWMGEICIENEEEGWPEESWENLTYLWLEREIVDHSVAFTARSSVKNIFISLSLSPSLRLPSDRNKAFNRRNRQAPWKYYPHIQNMQHYSFPERPSQPQRF